jgi:hypothetical protein
MSEINGNQDNFLSVKEFSERVHYSEHHVRTLIRKGKIQGHKAEDRRKWYIPLVEINRFKGEIKKVPVDNIKVSENVEKPNVTGNTKLINHFEQIADVANQILGGLGHIKAISKNSFKCYGEYDKTGFESKILSRDDLVDFLQCNLIAAYNKNSTIVKFFLKHIEAEDEKCREIIEYAKSSPVELFNLLQLISLKKELRGECDICNSWH